MAGFAIYVVLALTFASLSIAAGDNLNELVGLVMGASLGVGSVGWFYPRDAAASEQDFTF